MKARRVSCGAKPGHPACEPGLTRRLHNLHRASCNVASATMRTTTSLASATQRIPSAFAAARSWQGTARVRMAPLQLRPRLRRQRSPRPPRQLSSASPIRSAPRSRQRLRPSPSPSPSRRRRRRRWRSRRLPQRYRVMDTTARTLTVTHMLTARAQTDFVLAQAAWPELGKVKCQKTLVSLHLQTHTQTRMHKHARAKLSPRDSWHGA